MSIIFDKGAAEKAANVPKEVPAVEPDIALVKSAYPHGYPPMIEGDIKQHQLIVDPSQMVAPMELDEQSQYAMYGSMTDQPLVFNEIPTGVPPPTPVSVAPSASIAATSQLQLSKSKKFVDASNVAAVLTLPENIPTPPVQILDANGKLMKIPDATTHTSAIDKYKPTNRMIELDDLAMLGIDADDLAAQCI